LKCLIIAQPGSAGCQTGKDQKQPASSADLVDAMLGVGLKVVFTLEMPAFARIEVAAANRDDPWAGTNHMRLSPLYYPF